MTVVVVTHPSLPFALQQERQAVALCLHSDHARMNIWRASLRHERPERPGVQSPRADVRSACACVRQSSFCEAQDVLHTRQALSHVFLAASMCEALTSRRTRASSVRRGQIRRMALKPEAPACALASWLAAPPVTAASHTSAIPFAPDGGRHHAALPNVGSRSPGPPRLLGVVRPAPAPEGVREVRSLAQLRCSPTSRPPPPQPEARGEGRDHDHAGNAVRQNRVILGQRNGASGAS